MGTYKVIQDIEAEDKLLGPLTLRQFIYAAIVIVTTFIAFKLALVSPLLAFPFLPIIGFFGLLAAPFGHDQSSEVWLLAKIQFMFKPRRRIWNQDGMQELVTITAPKKVEKHLTDGLSQTEVKSRLQALANTIDSRGWAVKNVDTNLYAQPGYLNGQSNDDRLIDVANLPQEVPTYDIYAADDIMDETNNATAQQLNTMINQSEQAHRQAVVATMQSDSAPTTAQTPPADYWFMNQPPALPEGMAAFGTVPVIAPNSQPQSTGRAAPPDATESALLEQIHSTKKDFSAAYGHTKVLQPQAEEPPPLPPIPSINPVIQEMSQRNDLTISTISHITNEDKPKDDGEVIVSLHGR